MLGLPPRCGQSKVRSFFTYTPLELVKSIPDNLHWYLWVPWHQSSVHMKRGGEYHGSIHNLSKRQATKLMQQVNKGLETHEDNPLEFEVSHR